MRLVTFCMAAAIWAALAQQVVGQVHRQRWSGRLLLGKNKQRQQQRIVKEGLFRTGCGRLEGDAALPKLDLIATWESQKLRQSTDITTAFDMAFDQLPALKQSCQLWDGILAAAVYVPLVASEVSASKDAFGLNLQQIMTQLSHLHEATDRAGSCKLDLALWTEEVAQGSLQALLYPRNALRNRALTLAKSELVLLSDVDLVPSKSLAERSGYEKALLKALKRKAIVIPAFDISPSLNAREAKAAILRTVGGGKEMAVALHAAGNLTLLQHRQRPKATRASICEAISWSADHHEKWIQSSFFFSIAYTDGFRPILLVARRMVPWFDERFRGLVDYTAIHARHLNSLGFTFSVHPAAFMLHVPRPLQEQVGRMPAIITQHAKKMRVLEQKVQVQIDAKRYDPYSFFMCAVSEAMDAPDQEPTAVMF